MQSIVKTTSTISLPLINGHHSMIPFDLDTLDGLTSEFQEVANSLLQDIHHRGGTAFFTIHGKTLLKGQTLRRGGPHTDGSYDKSIFSWGGGGWKVGENGPPLTSKEHSRLYNSTTGGIILASNFSSCKGWVGDFKGLPGVGGDCRHIKLNNHFNLYPNVVYYGNNHFIHESISVSANIHRVFARITMPKNHIYR